MSYITYNLRYYAAEIERYERAPLSEEELLEAKRLLKILDDLADEGYYELSAQVEARFSGVSRLRRLLAANGQKPFPLVCAERADDAYGDAQELERYLDGLWLKACGCSGCDDPFLDELAGFCRRIGRDDETAYIFLLRDALLPYLYYRGGGAQALYPWLVGRAFFDFISPESNIDDVVRGVIFEALERGFDDYRDFFSFCRPVIRESLSPFPKVIDVLERLLATVKEPKIVVVESGCHGTFPMLLSALDDRVEFRLFTAVPYLLRVYGERVYSAEYEKNRLFETFFCHERLFRFCGFHNGKFFVEENLNGQVLEKARREICGIIGKRVEGTEL